MPHVQDFDALVAGACLVPLQGWDFSCLAGRAVSEPLPWNYLEMAGVHPLEARRHHVAAWVRQLGTEPSPRTRKPLAATSVTRRLACLSKFYGYRLEVGVVTHSPVPHVRRPRVSQDSTSVGLPRDELRRVLDTATATPPAPQPSSTCSPSTASGSPRLSTPTSTTSVHDRGHRALRITRKGGKIGRVAIAPVTSRALDTYIADRTTGPIFLNRDNTNRLSYTSAYKQLRRLTKTAGIAGAENITPNTFATEALDAGAALQDVQDALGHAAPAPPAATTAPATSSTRTPPALAEAMGRL